MQVSGNPNNIYMYVTQALPTHSKTFSSSQGGNEMEWNGVGIETLHVQPTLNLWRQDIPGGMTWGLWNTNFQFVCSTSSCLLCLQYNISWPLNNMYFLAPSCWLLSSLDMEYPSRISFLQYKFWVKSSQLQVQLLFLEANDPASHELLLGKETPRYKVNGNRKHNKKSFFFFTKYVTNHFYESNLVTVTIVRVIKQACRAGCRRRPSPAEAPPIG